jgi:metal-responsive CopG/Arc/MetJ family transcriptional regulator
MATSIHLPKPLLDAVDRRAHALRISRSRLIARALERELTDATDWSPEFFVRLGASDAATVEAVDEMLRAIRSARRSKGPRKL